MCLQDHVCNDTFDPRHEQGGLWCSDNDNMPLTKRVVLFRPHKKLGSSTHYSHMTLNVTPNVLDAVITSEYDILPILLRRVRDRDLAFFLETVTLVCKMWLRACRNVDSPDKRLRDALAQEDVHLASDLRIDCLWLLDSFNRDNAVYMNVVKLSTYNQSPDSAKICVGLLRKAIGSFLRQHGGWRGRELRRLHSYRIREGSKTHFPPPSAILKGNTAMALMRASLASYGIPKCFLDTLMQWEEKYATRPEKKEKHAKLWNDAINTNSSILIRRPLCAINGIAILSGSNAMGAPVTTYYMVVLCYDYTSLGYQLVRLPSLIARTIEADMRAFRDSLPGHPDWVLWPCSPNNCAISPSMSGWEILCDV